MAYNPHQKLTDNIAAIRVALANEKPSASAIDILQRFSGFGGIKAVLYPPGDRKAWIKLGATKEDFRLFDSVTALHQLLQEKFSDDEYVKIIQSLKNSVLTAFYTPQIVPQILYEVLYANKVPIKNIYEPSAGAGVFIAEATKHFKDIERITAVEKDILTGHVLQAFMREQNVACDVQIKGFEETSSSENGTCDLIVSNIPFGNFSVYDPNYPKDTISGKIHNYFFAKGLDKIKDGGLLAYITTDAFLNAPSNRAAREHVFRPCRFYCSCRHA